MKYLKYVKNQEIERNTLIGFLPSMIATGVLKGSTEAQIGGSYLASDLLVSIPALITGSIVLLAASIISENSGKIDKGALIAIFSTLILLGTLSFRRFSVLEAGFNSFKILAAVTLVEILLLYALKKDFLNWKFVFPTFGHFFDAATTVTAIQAGSRELNPLVRALNTFIGNYSIFAVKVAIIVPVVAYIVESDMEYRNVLLLLITGIGVVVGTGNLVS